MKKIYGLMLVPVLALSGCVSKISNEEGVKRAKEIAAHELKDEDLKNVRLDSTISMNISGKEDGKAVSAKGDTVTVQELSLEKDYIHTLTKGNSKTVNDGKTKEEKTESETWFYVKDNKFYTVERVVENGKEEKEYSEGDVSDFSFIKAMAKVTALASLKGTAELALTSAALVQKEEEAKTSGMEYKLGAYSGGEGSLVIKGNVIYSTYSVEEGVKIEGSGKAKVKMVWSDYKLQESSLKLNFSGKNEEKKVEAKVSVKTSEKVSQKVTVSYPDLKGYKKA